MRVCGLFGAKTGKRFHRGCPKGSAPPKEEKAEFPPDSSGRELRFFVFSRFFLGCACRSSPPNCVWFEQRQIKGKRWEKLKENRNKRWFPWRQHIRARSLFDWCISRWPSIRPNGMTTPILTRFAKRTAAGLNAATGDAGHYQELCV